MVIQVDCFPSKTSKCQLKPRQGVATSIWLASASNEMKRWSSDTGVEDFGPKMVQIDTKWVKFGTFKDIFQYEFVTFEEQFSVQILDF